ncbi:HDOD domain-containing protein [Anaeroarcus burkinensis]|uniref:HDOD domain-containing protein n=1 Tax=Anaeroarcus burkinensis TaxID=82376 RepID=UPI00041748F1|nr:HDOD domain-containing protein [Anaeroarcus burkinensis]
MKASILFVDDEKPILRSLRRLFQETDYELFFVESGDAALRFLQLQRVDLIISDMRMPEMDGHQLLRRVKELYPQTMRVILSGFAEKNKIFSSLLDGAAQMYLLKPWGNEQLLSVVNNILCLQNRLREKKLLTQIEYLGQLPAFPDSYSKLCSLMEEEADIKEIASLVEADPVITGKLLQVANSAFYGVKIGSIQQAISYLGLGVLKDLVLVSGLFTPVLAGAAERKALDLFWSHSVQVNSLVHALYKEVYNKNILEEFSSIGLLHDLGVVALIKGFKDNFSVWPWYKEKLLEGGVNGLLEAERNMFGVAHNEMGGYLLHWWHLPYVMVEAALFHHEPLEEHVINKELSCLVHLADAYSWKLMLKKECLKVEEAVWRFVGLRPESIEKIVESTKCE